MARPAPTVPKKGKARAAHKRPATKKTQQWKNVPYTRDEDVEVGPQGQRIDRIKWRRTLPELLKASDRDIIKKIVRHRFLPKWTGKKCPRCGVGRLSALEPHPTTGSLKHRCRARNCRHRINPHHLHPLLTEGSGPQAQSLQTQAGILFLKLLRIPHPAIHVMFGTNHKALEDIENKICASSGRRGSIREKHRVRRLEILERCRSRYLATFG